MKRKEMNVISGFRRKVAENYAVLRCDAASNFLPMIRDNQSVLFSGFKNVEP